MTAIMSLLRELAGLFVDDGRLALSVLAVVALAAILSLMPGASLAAGAVLVLGCLGALIANVVKAARR
ncbi:MAG TPA: hypothetical protein VH249_11680 [Xanthobacteraceae bacterium]|jgi:hypothetical protein|nr:hypothetical protein [Xanthobacteraceae bacterium]